MTGGVRARSGTSCAPARVPTARYTHRRALSLLRLRHAQAERVPMSTLPAQGARSRGGRAAVRVYRSRSSARRRLELRPVRGPERSRKATADEQNRQDASVSRQEGRGLERRPVRSPARGVRRLACWTARVRHSRVLHVRRVASRGEPTRASSRQEIVPRSRPRVTAGVRCQSGRTDETANLVSTSVLRGFKSHPHRSMERAQSVRGRLESLSSEQVAPASVRRSSILRRFIVLVKE